jgi:hypothetical protein
MTQAIFTKWMKNNLLQNQRIKLLKEEAKVLEQSLEGFRRDEELLIYPKNIYGVVGDYES